MSFEKDFKKYQKQINHLGYQILILEYNRDKIKDLGKKNHTDYYSIVTGIDEIVTFLRKMYNSRRWILEIRYYSEYLAFLTAKQIMYIKNKSHALD